MWLSRGAVVPALLVVEENVPGWKLAGQAVAMTVGLGVLLHGVSLHGV